MSSPASSDSPRPESGTGETAKSGLAGTFATLLAVEQGELPPSALTPPAVGTEAELVDRIARRVVEQISDRAVREMAADIVSRTAERLVREEIEHVRKGQHGARSTKQAIAIGLYKARRAGVDVPPWWTCRAPA